MSEQIRKVTVRIEIETNKSSYKDVLEQGENETNKEFRDRVDAVLWLRMKAS